MGRAKIRVSSIIIIMKTFQFLFLAICFTMSMAKDLRASNRVEILSLQTAYCDYCDMVFTGTYSVKVCGNKDCCYTPWLTGNFNIGEIDSYTGPSQLGECSEFELMDDTMPLSMSMTVFHQGTDGGQLDNINVRFSDGKEWTCKGFEYVDDNQWTSSADCQGF